MGNKRFKLKLPRINIPSIQFCRLNSPSSLPIDPKPAKYTSSPVNPKAFDIIFPGLTPRASDGCDSSSELSLGTDDDSLVLLDSSRRFSKLRESVVVVKKSDDPYEDFKRSMLEMIMEKHMYDVAELEELLRCLLTLNFTRYHGVIVEAFCNVWEILFSD